MRKKLFAIFSILFLLVSLVGCGETTVLSVNVENSNELNNTSLVIHSLIKLGDELWYDSTTRIVYLWNGSYGGGSYSSTMPTPYYAPNGLPYRYNSETNTFEEIKFGL